MSKQSNWEIPVDAWTVEDRINWIEGNNESNPRKLVKVAASVVKGCPYLDDEQLGKEDRWLQLPVAEWQEVLKQLLASSESLIENVNQMYDEPLPPADETWSLSAKDWRLLDLVHYTEGSNEGNLRKLVRAAMNAVQACPHLTDTTEYGEWMALSYLQWAEVRRRVDATVAETFSAKNN